VTDPLRELRAAVLAAAAEIGEAKSAPTLERPRQAGHGDFSTNAAMLLAKSAGAPPREIAERLAASLGARLGDDLASAEVAGPGFLNLVMSDRWHHRATAHVLEEGFGGGGAQAPEKVNVEFVSANPTGPVHVGGTRNAAYGDSLARLLEFHGHDVTREFYINDYGSQVVRFAESLRARARGEDVPEGGYQGEYVAEVAAEIPGAADMDLDELGRRGVAVMVERAKASLRRFGVEFDVWFSEASLHPDGVAHGFERLAELGETYRREGALWVRTSAHGDDKDRVIERSDGEHTYFASDIAYHVNKRERGFDRLIDVWGADHHGYVQRVKAMFEALGGDRDKLELIIMQFVHLVERGERAQMSKRAGEFVSLDELVEEIGVDAARWFLLARSHDTTVDLDLDLAREQSAENPVYYVQYAHARIESVKRKAGDAAREIDPTHPSDLHPSERALIQKLLTFPDEVREATDRRAPHRIVAYALELAQSFTAFYRDCQIVGSPEQPFRLALSDAAQGVLARALGLLGVSAPKEM
jgi:arginyl-tRNA synthetase